MAALSFPSWILFAVLTSLLKPENSVSALCRPNTLPELWLKLNILNISDDCKKEFQRLIFNRTDDLAKALDAFGRPEAGILVQNWNWFGHFPECTGLEGLKFCLLEVDLNTSYLTTIEDHIFIHWGTCFPQKCSTEDIKEASHVMLGHLNLQRSVYDATNVNRVEQCVEDPVVHYSAGFYISIVLFTLFGLLVISGSMFDVTERRFLNTGNAENNQNPERSSLIQKDGRELTESYSNAMTTPDSDAKSWRNIVDRFICGIRLLLLDFAFNRNLKRLLHVDERTDDDINCLNGIRVLSLMWIILGHVIDPPIAHDHLYNPIDASSELRGTLHQAFISNFVFAVDTFFFMGGLLVCFNTLRQLERKDGHVNWLLFYMHRFIRLLPILIGTLLIFMFITPHLIWGPRAPYFADRRSCTKYWWTTMLFVNNLYPSMKHLCMQWTWYLANDMQFFVISPLFIYAIYRNPFMGLGFFVLLLSTCVGATGFLVAYENFTFPIYLSMEHPATDLIYRGPFVRLSPYLVGQITGFILFKCKANRTTFPKVVFYLGWIITTCVMMAILFGAKVNRPMGIAGSVLYESLSHLCWGISLLWVVLACKFGGSGWINDILSWKFWAPLSRVTYAAYLLHPVLIIIIGGHFVRPLYYSTILLIFYFGAVVFYTYLMAMVISLVVEIPLVNLERRLLLAR